MKQRKFAEGGIYRSGMEVPQDIDGASATPKSTMKKPPMAAKKSPTPKTSEKEFVPAYGSDDKYARKREKDRAEMAQQAREVGRLQGAARQDKAAGRGGVLGTPAAYVERAGQYIGDKFDDADAYLSEKMGMQDRATFKKGVRQGLKDEGYKEGGKVSSASKRADGCAIRGKTRA
jgi:hypothetical protein